MYPFRSQQETKFIPDGSDEGIVMKALLIEPGGRTKVVNKR